MIYLIITTSINNKYGNNTERKERYLYAISETLKLLPKEITPIIVENNGMDVPFLNLLGNVIYTNNNIHRFKNKGVNEMLDIKEVIQNFEMDDIIIKLTGRYRALSPQFFNYVIKNQNYDAIVKFFNVCTMNFEPNDCVLGCYAIKVKYLKMFNALSMENSSPECVFAKYVKMVCNFKEIDFLDIECCFSDDLRILHV